MGKNCAPCAHGQSQNDDDLHDDVDLMFHGRSLQKFTVNEPPIVLGSMTYTAFG